MSVKTIGMLTLHTLVFVTQMVVWVCQTNEIFSAPYCNSAYHDVAAQGARLRGTLLKLFIPCCSPRSVQDSYIAW